jgi:Na+/melibiose symporter-like transporter
LATIIGGIALDLINFPKGAQVGEIAPETVYLLGLIAGPPAMIVGLSSLWFYYFYELSRERMEEITHILEERRASASHSDPSLALVSYKADEEQ